MHIRDFLPHREDIILGHRFPPLPYPLYRLRLADQQYHATIWGRTGSGKSRLLQSLFLQHLAKGHGVAIIEPHHDLSFSTLATLIAQGFFRQESAFSRLVYVDWGNGSFVPFSVLSGKQHPHTIALHALEAMIRVWPELRAAPTFQTLFLSAMTVLIANKLPITFLYQLLTDRPLRARCLQQVSEPLIHHAFASYDKLRDQAQEAGSTLRRAFLLSFNPAARLTLGQPENWLDFRSIMDEGRALIINLGNIEDNETKRLIGAMVLVQLEQAALSRTDLPPAQRRPFTVLVDEWPSFAAQDDTIGTILSQTRKFNFRLYLAAQSTSQITSERLSGALENCRLNIAFGLGRDSAVSQSQQLAKIDPFLLKEAPATPTQHGQYVSVLEQFESVSQELMDLPVREAYIKLHSKQAVRIRTLPVRDSSPRQHDLAAVLARYKSQYQRTKQEAEAAIGSIQLPVDGPLTVAKRPFTLFSSHTVSDPDVDLLDH
jgi:hypothetical protein